MRVLITGGAGFIGRHITEYFQNRAEVRVLDNLRPGFESNLTGFECDLAGGLRATIEFFTKDLAGIEQGHPL